MNPAPPSISSERSSPITYFQVAGGCLAAATAVLLALPYSYGVGTHPYSLARLFWTTWTEDENWQHCMFVPIISCVLIYLRRHTLATAPRGNSGWAVVPMVISLLLYVIGIQADVFVAGEFAVFLFVLSGFIWLFGWAGFKSVLFPLCFLIFAIPIPASETLIAFPLRLYMSNMAVQMLNLIGIAAIKVGTAVVSAPNDITGLAEGKKFAVDIANPCSGIRSLFALMMVSALYAWFSVKPAWKQILVFLCSIPLAVAGNLARILLLVFGTIMFGSQFAVGTEEHPTWFHLLAGYAVFIVALGGLVLIGWILQSDPFAALRKAKSKAGESASQPPSPAEPSSENKDVY